MSCHPIWKLATIYVFLGSEKFGETALPGLLAKNLANLSPCVIRYAFQCNQSIVQCMEWQLHVQWLLAVVEDLTAQKTICLQ